MNDWGTNVDRDGFAVIPEVLSRDQVSVLLDAVASTDDEVGVRKRSSMYAIRNLLSSVPAVSQLATGQQLMDVARSVLGKSVRPVKGTLFDKTPDANWLVPWHQDLTICVNERVDLDGYGPWTVKAGVVNVQPPVSVLERMLAIRIHLDDCDEQNGALRVLPATHKCGRLNSEQIASAQSHVEPVTCGVLSGGAVLMRPLLLHASSPARNPKHRRVIHIDYAAVDLPPGLDWLTGEATAGKA